MPLDVVRARLSSHRLSGSAPSRPVDVVRRFGAVQAQDYLASLWAIGLRAGAASESAVEAAAMDASIVRTWPMRGTLHFVAAEDVRWMLDLLAPRVIARGAGRHRQLELDADVFTRSERLIVKALEGGAQLTRPAIYRILGHAGIDARGSRGLHILAYLSQKGVLCFGRRQGKQPSFALLEEWVPPATRLSTEEALAELARRYFTSHGPAGVHDFTWWSGLKVSDARKGIALASGTLEERVVDGRRLWSCGVSRQQGTLTPAAHLLPFYDEYTVAYRDRSDIVDAEHARKVGAGGILNPTILIDGRVVGTWRRDLRGDRVHVAPEPFGRMTRRQEGAVEAAAARYAAFLGRELVFG